MKLSSHRFKALAVTLGFSIWFLVISSAAKFFSLETFAIFIVLTILVTQIFSVKLSKILDAFAIFNTKIFLGMLFVFVISLYGILFRTLRIDLFRLKKQDNSYWLQMEQLEESRVLRQY